MRMANFIVRDAIIPDLKAATRDEAIREVVASLSAAGQLPQPIEAQRRQQPFPPAPPAT